MATRIGEMPCLNPKCGCTDVAVEETPAGTWQSKCHKCGLPTFGKKGTKFRRDMEALTKLDADPAPADPKPAAPAPAPVVAPSPVPAPRRANSAFSLADLK